MGSSTAKEHHLVPQWWLRAFAESGHILGRRRSGAERRTPLRRAAVARNFNTDPLVEGEQRVVLETYLDRHVDGPSAPVMRALRTGLSSLENVRESVVLDFVAWQVVRTRAFRSFDAQVCRHLFPAMWALEAVGHAEERLKRPLTEVERMEVFWTSVRVRPILPWSMIRDRLFGPRSEHSSALARYSPLLAGGWCCCTPRSRCWSSPIAG
ncbi:DUF4238 domain-containing protein [Streptomyces sp. C8S0]|uniref:DUF4238 domain-containing protein n=1 Tax=Streptomyces sp. C8S0 TaxID=2585716 RepID=UPI00186713A8|nr:DUF4238 domain-containing protein [Streptomyces sp. C8S0]